MNKENWTLLHFSSPYPKKMHLVFFYLFFSYFSPIQLRGFFCFSYFEEKAWENRQGKEDLSILSPLCLNFLDLSKSDCLRACQHEQMQAESRSPVHNFIPNCLSCLQMGNILLQLTHVVSSRLISSSALSNLVHTKFICVCTYSSPSIQQALVSASYSSRYCLHRFKVDFIFSLT